VSDDGYAPPAKKPPRVLAIVLALLAVALSGYAMFSKRWLYNPGTILEVREGEAKGAVYGDSHKISIGLRSLEICHREQCETRSNSEHVGSWRDTVLVLRYASGEPIEEALRDAGGDTLLDRAKRERAEVLEAVAGGVPLRSHAELVVARQLLTYSSAWAPVGWVTFVLLGISALSLLISAGFVIARRQLQWPVMPTTIALLASAAVLVIGCMFGALKLGPAGYVGVSFGFFAFGGAVLLGFTAALLLNKHLRPDDHDLLEDSMNPEQF
jgi:hypothetical protein